MDLVKKLIELAYYYRTDEAAGKPYWLDPTVIGLAVSLIAMGLLRWAGVNIDADLQLKIVGVITGIGALLSPHTGVVKHPAQVAAETAKELQQHNLSSLS